MLRLDHQGLERLREEAGASLGGAGVHLEVDLLRIHPGLEQLRRDSKRPRAGIAEAEPTGIGENGDVEPAGRLLRDGPRVRQRQFEDQLAGGRRVGVEVARAGRQQAHTHMVVHTGDGDAAVPHRLP